MTVIDDTQLRLREIRMTQNSELQYSPVLILRQADRREGDDADGRRPEERPLVFRDHLADHLELVLAGLDADLDPLDDDDGVVREHAQRDDERAERDALHQEVALHVHDEERRHDREEQHHADDQPGLAAHREQQHHEDDA